MEKFLNMERIILPYSYEYIKVLELVSIIANSIYYFYFMWLFGSVFLAYYLEFIRRDDVSTFIADKVLSLPLKKLSLPIVLGVFSIIVVFSLDLVIFQDGKFLSLILINGLMSFVFILGLAFAWTYKYTYQLINLLQKSALEESSKHFIQFIQNNFKVHRISSKLALVFLTIGLFALASSFNYKIDLTLFEVKSSLTSYLFNLIVIVRFLELVTLSLAISLLTTFFYYIIWQEKDFELSVNFQDRIKKFTINFGLITLLPLPLFLFLEIFLLPSRGLSYSIFLVVGVAVLLIFLIINKLNAYKKEELHSLGTYSFYVLVIIVILFATKDTFTVANSLKPSFIQISRNFVKYEEDLKSKLNISTININPEEIFNAKCVACHEFDKALVGPPYNLVLPKYENDSGKLAKFILNPVKVDPAYPPMPAQGLIPAEADALADYLLKTYKERVK